jgi:hypothetical protein
LFALSDLPPLTTSKRRPQALSAPHLSLPTTSPLVSTFPSDRHRRRKPPFSRRAMDALSLACKRCSKGSLVASLCSFFFLSFFFLPFLLSVPFSGSRPAAEVPRSISSSDDRISEIITRATTTSRYVAGQRRRSSSPTCSPTTTTDDLVLLELEGKGCGLGDADLALSSAR